MRSTSAPGNVFSIPNSTPIFFTVSVLLADYLRLLHRYT
jgi:hypothetical protein